MHHTFTALSVVRSTTFKHFFSTTERNFLMSCNIIVTSVLSDGQKTNRPIAATRKDFIVLRIF